MTREIVHEQDQQRFTLEIEGQSAYLVYRMQRDGVYDFASTYVPPGLRGRGIGARVVHHALEHARANDWQVIPSCWFVREVIERNPDYEPLLAG